MYKVSGELTVILITLVVAKFRDRMAVSKQAVQKFDGERFNLRMLNEMEVRKQHQTEITNRFEALENISDDDDDDDDDDINRDWENIKETIKTSATESLVCTN